ncbi:MAG: ABC transporter ATP-binding protein [Candidatus Omnitrophica bacterium]|nr:ABC transporter ATP-binding protein [Candidatus Omnitrophota bacterium]
MKDYRKLFSFARPYYRLLGLAGFFMGIVTLLDIFRLSAIVPLVDRVFTNKPIIFASGKFPPFVEGILNQLNAFSPLKVLYLMLLIMPIALVIRALFEYFQSYIMSDVGQKVIRDVRNQVYDRLQSLSLEYFTQKRSGELVSRITNDVKLIENAVSYALTDLIYQSLNVIAFAIMTFIINWRLAFISVAVLPMVAIPMYSVGKVLRKLSRKSQEKIADINSLLVEEGEISFGMFTLFMAALLSLIKPFKKLSQANSIMEQALAASSRIYEVLETKPTVVENAKAREFSGFKESIVFEKVWFSYEKQEILKDINLEVKIGSMLAIVGPSGTGKTTFVDLIPRFYDPGKGRILIDGIDTRELSLKSLRKQIGIVTQETILFNDTVRANIAYGSPAASQAEIEEAALKAHAHDFISHFPQGYDTIIGDRGVKMSGGERQRIAIARALLKNPPILILDEATSQLDSEAERIVQEALDRLVKGRTVFVIAHRLSTIRFAQRIIVLDKGRIVEEGSHNELIGGDGLYKRLYQFQELEK